MNTLLEDVNLVVWAAIVIGIVWGMVWATDQDDAWDKEDEEERF